MKAETSHNNSTNWKEYSRKLADPRWHNKKQMIKQRDNNTFIICGARKNLQVHHRKYQCSKQLSRFNDPWAYDEGLLITLCQDCHNKGHQLYKVPTNKSQYKNRRQWDFSTFSEATATVAQPANSAIQSKFPKRFLSRRKILGLRYLISIQTDQAEANMRSMYFYRPIMNPKGTMMH